MRSQERFALVGLVLLALASTGCASGRGAAPPLSFAGAGGVTEPQPTDAAREVVAFSRAQVHKRYCRGGTGPSCFDCSGLAQTAWRQAGVRLPRTSEEIASRLPEVPLDRVRAGDILWWPGHVGIYIGEGWMVDALSTRRGVVERPVRDPHRAFRPLM